MNFEIVPYAGAGALKFGLIRDEARALVPEEADVKLMPEGNLPIDYYSKGGFYAIYDKYNQLACLEFLPASTATFQGKDLLRMNWRSLITFFKALDPDLEETQKEFLSWKFGISAFAPDKDKNPMALPASITVFKKDFFYVKNGIPDPKDVNSFHIQAAFVEGIEKTRTKHTSLAEAYSEIFRNNLEYGILIWNSVPVRFSYYNDLPVLLEPILHFVHEISRARSGSSTVELSCLSFALKCNARWDEEVIVIEPEWKHVSGNYETALNQHGSLTVLKKDFIAEWKKIFEQCVQAFKLSGISLTSDEANKNYQLLTSLEKKITVPGKFYQGSGKVMERSADGRWNANLFRLKGWKKNLIGLGIIVIVFGVVWLMGRNDGFPLFSLESFITALIYTAAISIPLTTLVYFYLKRKKA